MGYLLLASSVITAVSANICVKMSYGFSKWMASILAFLFYGLCGFLLVLTVRHMELGILYGIWAGLTVSATALAGIVWFCENAGKRKLFSIAVIIAGVILLHAETH